VSFFKGYRDKVACGKTDKEYQECLITEDIIKDFEVSPSYQQVYKNLDYTSLYSTQINDVNKFKATVGDKSLYSYPYDEVKFTIGDYISYTDATKELTHWVLVALDTQHLYRVKGEITKCNNIFKFVDDFGTVYEYPCIIEEKLVLSGMSSGKEMTIPEGRFQVTLQLNDDTLKIKEDTRALFNNLGYQGSKDGVQATRVTNFVNMTEKYFLKLYVEKDQVNPLLDDVDNLIADKYKSNFSVNIQQENFSQTVGYSTTLNAIVSQSGSVIDDVDLVWSSSDNTIGTITQAGYIDLISEGQVAFTATIDGSTGLSDSVTIDVVSVPVGVEETIIEPTNYDIIQGDSRTYSVYKYIDNVAQLDAFSIVASGIPSENYNIDVQNNGFTIDNISTYNEPLVVEMTNNVTLDVSIVNINLKGFW